LAVKTASEMTHTVSGAALNPTQSNPYRGQQALPEIRHNNNNVIISVDDSDESQ